MEYLEFLEEREFFYFVLCIGEASDKIKQRFLNLKKERFLSYYDQKYKDCLDFLTGGL